MFFGLFLPHFSGAKFLSPPSGNVSLALLPSWTPAPGRAIHAASKPQGEVSSGSLLWPLGLTVSSKSCYTGNVVGGIPD